MNDTVTIFERIIRGELPSVKVYEDDTCIAIMDAFPSIPGQVLIIPKLAVDYAFALDDTTYQHLFGVAKKIAVAIDQALKPLRTCLVVEGFEVPHAHIKLYPTTAPKLTLVSGERATPEALEAIASKIRAAL